MPENPNGDRTNTRPGLVPEVVNVIADKGMMDMLADLGEGALDLALDEGALKEIPVVGSLVKLYKIGMGVKEHLFLKKLLRFLHQLYSVSDEDRERFREHLSENPKFRNNVGEKIILLLERADEMEKADLIGKAFAAYLQGRIDYEQFMKMAAGIDRGLMSDLLQLARMDKSYLRTEEQWGTNLMAAGLMKLEVVSLYGGSCVSYSLNEAGKFVREICFSMKE